MPRRRRVNRTPKVHIDLAEPFTKSPPKIKTEVVNTEIHFSPRRISRSPQRSPGVPSSSIQPGNPSKSPYSLRACHSVTLIPVNDESSDGDFLSSSDEYQPSSDNDQSESSAVLWEDSDDSDLEWTDIKIEPGSGLVRCESEDRIIYPRVSTKSVAAKKGKKKSRTSTPVVSLRSSGLRTRSNKVYAPRLINYSQKSGNQKSTKSHQRNKLSIQKEGNSQRGNISRRDVSQDLDEFSPADNQKGPELENFSDTAGGSEGCVEENENGQDQQRSERHGVGETGEEEEEEVNAGRLSRKQPAAPSTIRVLSYSDSISILVRNTLTKHEQKSWCMFCGQKVSKLGQHLLYKHLKEREVEEMNSYGINTYKRKQKLQVISDKGLCLHNDQVLQAGRGMLVPLRTPGNLEELTTDQFCEGCYVFVEKNFVESHKLSCRRHSEQLMDSQEDVEVSNEEQSSDDPLRITEDMISYVEDKLQQIPGSGQITVIQEKQHNASVVCALCNITPCHFSRHLRQAHSDVPTVKETLELPKGSKERKMSWTRLRNTFYFLNTKAVLEAGSGELVVGYTGKNKDPRLLRVCPTCYGLFYAIKPHLRKCQNIQPVRKVKLCECMLPCVEDSIVEGQISHSGSNDGQEEDPRRAIEQSSKCGMNGSGKEGINWQNRSDGEKKFRKVNCCVYCHCPQHKMYRHYTDMHSTEEDVQKALKFPKQSQQRRNVFSMLILRGNNEHNKRVLEKGRGTLIPPRKLQVLKDPEVALQDETFSYCSECFARVRSVSLWGHMKRHRLSREAAAQRADKDDMKQREDHPVDEAASEKENDSSVMIFERVDNATQNGEESISCPQVEQSPLAQDVPSTEPEHHRQDWRESQGIREEVGRSSHDGAGAGNNNMEGELPSEQEKRDVEEMERHSGSGPVKQNLGPSAEDQIDKAPDECQKQKDYCIITKKRGSKTIPHILKYNADISIFLSTIQSFCPYCHKSSINMIKHLKDRHAAESDVQEAIRMPREFEAGQRLWSELITWGNREHNDRVMQAGCGDLVPLKRLQRKTNIQNYEFCFSCYLFIKKSQSMHKYFCKNSRPTFDDIEEENLRRSAVESKNICLCKAIKATSKASSEQATISNHQHRRKKKKSAPNFHIRSDSAINFDQWQNRETGVVSKRNCCLYCQKLQVKMATHMKRTHTDKKEVQQALAYPKRSKIRRQLFVSLIRKGNYQHNQRVSHLGQGFMIPVHVHSQRVGDLGRYVHCDSCLGLYLRRSLRTHQEKGCPGRPDNAPSPQDITNGSEEPKTRHQPQRAASHQVEDLTHKADVEMLNVSSSDQSDEEWDRMEYRHLQRVKQRRLQKRRLLPEESESLEGAVQQEAPKGGTVTIQEGPTKAKRKMVARKGVRLWSDEEMAAIDSFFSDQIHDLKVPGKEQCEAAKARFPEALKRRDWRGIKFCVYNKIQTRRKQESQEEATEERIKNSQKRSDKPCGTPKRSDKQPWTLLEVRAVEEHMQTFIADLVTPGKLDCLKVKRRCRSALRKRSWKQIKFYVYNRVLKKRKTQSDG